MEISVPAKHISEMQNRESVNNVDRLIGLQAGVEH
jgi:hypothetical protein